MPRDQERTINSGDAGGERKGLFREMWQSGKDKELDGNF